MVIDVLNPATGHDLDTEADQGSLGKPGQFFGKCWQEAGRALHQNDPSAGRIDMTEFPIQTVPGKLRDSTGQFDTRRAAADDHEGEQAPLLLGILGILGFLECQEQAMPDMGSVVDLLKPGRYGLPLLVAAEIAVPGARGQHQIVIADSPIAEQHLIRRGIDVGHPAEQDPRIRLVAQKGADRRGDVRRRQRRRRHLIEQRLEQVIVAPVDEGDPAGCIAQGLRSAKATEASADDNHMWKLGKRGGPQILEARKPAAHTSADQAIQGQRPRSDECEDAEEKQPVLQIDSGKPLIPARRQKAER